MPDDGRKDWSASFTEELAEIHGPRPGKAAADERPLVGLALSGGGIRSATFGLGVLQALKQHGGLARFDYLSTVSGGGYIGGWLSANCVRHPTWLHPDTSWKSSIDHLRRYSNYLSPKVGFFSADTWSMASIWLRNALLIQGTVGLAIAAVLLAPRPLVELFQQWSAAGNLRWITIALYLIGVVGVAGNLLRITTGGAVALLRARLWPAGLAGAAVLLLAAWVYGRATGFDPFRTGEVDYASAAPVAVLLTVAAFLLQPVVVQLVRLFWLGKSAAPEQVNYTQGWAQAVVVIPLMAAAYLLAAVLWGEARGEVGPPALASIESYGGFVTSGWRFWPFPLSVVFVSMWLLSFCSVRSRRDWRGLAVATAAPVAAALVFHLLLSAIMALLRGWTGHPWGALHAFVWAPSLVAMAYFLTIVVLVGILGRQSTEGVREWWSRLAAWLGIYAAGWMVIPVSAVYGPPLVAWLTTLHPAAALSSGGGWIGTVLAGLFAAKSDATNGTDAKSTSQKAMEVLAAVAPFVFIAGVLVAVAWVLDTAIAGLGGVSWTVARGATADPPSLRPLLLTSAGCLAALLLMAARVDINDFSLNAFYRNRLVRAYLGASRFAPGERHPQNFTGFDDDDDLPLIALSGSPGPFHVVNCTMNLGGSSDLALHTRHGTAFTMTPLACGSHYFSREQTGEVREIGYVPTAAYGGAITLGQAIAVSGAAASPNSGYHTSPVVAFLLTLFNVRLGWWFPNPAHGATGDASPWFSLRYLIAELFGGAHDKSAFVMISDGGHFDNLGVYELVKRRCRLIVVSDAECDPGLTFAGLGTLIRMCDVDFGATISIDVGAIRRAPGAVWSTSPYAVGEIRYADGSTGTLVYLKAAMTGREDTAVQQYHADRPAFPHETTGDQFYGEDQFESYRRLGHDVASQAFADRVLPAAVAALLR